MKNPFKRKDENLEKIVTEKEKKAAEREEYRNKLNEARKHIFTFGMNEYLSINKKTIDNYSAILISTADSCEFYAIVAQNKALISLYDKMKKEGIEAVVDLKVSSSLSGQSHMINPSNHHVFLYGTGLIPKQ